MVSNRELALRSSVRNELTPVGEDFAQPHRRLPLVAIDNEIEARALAASRDPFGQPWTDERKFASDVIDDEPDWRRSL